MHFLHITNSDKPVAFYSLDVIISVGYRVKSQRGTRFRIWANKILKDYLVKGYAINEKRLKEKAQQLEELKKVVRLEGILRKQLKEINSIKVSSTKTSIFSNSNIESGIRALEKLLA